MQMTADDGVCQFLKELSRAQLWMIAGLHAGHDSRYGYADNCPML